MISVLIKSRQGYISSFKVEGHAGYGKKGIDIYCAGVSAICQTALAGLLYHLEQKPEYQLNRGLLTCTLAENLDDKDKEKAQLILKTMEIGLTEMQRTYKNYLRVTVMEE